MSLDECDPGPQSRCACGGHESRSSGADYDEIVSRSRFRILPCRRMKVIDKNGVMLVLRTDQGVLIHGVFLPR
jgi:hypothetical protein